MARKKNSGGLFEVISKTKETRSESGLSVPKWMGGSQAQAEAPPPPAEAPSVLPPSIKPKRPRPAPRPARAPAHKPTVFTAGRRLHLSMNFVSCAVVLASLVVLLVGAFLLGRWTAGDGGTIQASMGEPPLKRDVVPGDGKTTSTDSSTRVPGKHYLVIQNLMGNTETHKAEAFRIRDYCKEAGEHATVCSYDKDKSFIVWSLKPMDSPTSEAAIKYAEAIEKLGNGYFQKYHTYDFRQRNRQGKFDPMYIPHRPSSGS